jgi:NAD(P)-dependent dehydrogenase (short-subunit alcohol dehydrogenase family)
MKGRLEGKVAIVTGGGTGIGEAICKKFAREGATVVVCGLPDDPVLEVADEINESGGKAIAFLGDISDERDARECVEYAMELFGKLNVLVNNAGVFPEVAMLEDYPIEAFDYLLQHNLRSTFLMTRFALPELQKSKGNIISAGSEAGQLGLMQNTPYGGTKGFIHAFMNGLAVEQAQNGVRCNTVCPGPIDTAWTHKETSPLDSEMEKMMPLSTPLGRLGTVEEVANVYAFLASDEASFVTGAMYEVDGGITKAKGPVGQKAWGLLKSANNKPEGELDLQHEREGHTSIRRQHQRY